MKDKTCREVVLTQPLFNFITMHAFYCKRIINLSGKFSSTVLTRNIFHWDHRTRQTESLAEDWRPSLSESHCPGRSEQSSEPGCPRRPSSQGQTEWGGRSVSPSPVWCRRWRCSEGRCRGWSGPLCRPERGSVNLPERGEKIGFNLVLWENWLKYGKTED